MRPIEDAVHRLADSLPLLSLAALFQLSSLAALVVFALHRLRAGDQLRRLAEVASAIAHGDKNARAQLGHGPLRSFGEAFDDMVTLLVNEIRSLKATQRELEQLVDTDRLTGVGNRRQFEQQAEAECARARRYGLPISLILFDVDNFKSINDRFGHQIGDAVLVQLARRVASRLRDTDTIARWGGEEFAVLTPCTGVPGAEILAEKIRRVVAEEDFDIVGPVTISVGVAQLQPTQSAAQWIAAADEHLYRAKHAGRNCVIPNAPSGTDTAPFLLIWGEQFLVHHAAIDAEHEELFRLANTLILSENERKSDILLNFDSVLDHAADHFRHEEAILAELGCPPEAFAEHAQAHQGLLTQATELRSRFAQNRIDLTDVGDFIVRRLAVGHLLNADQKLFASLVSSLTMPVEDSARPSLRVRMKRAMHL